MRKKQQRFKLWLSGLVLLLLAYLTYQQHEPSPSEPSRSKPSASQNANKHSSDTRQPKPGKSQGDPAVENAPSTPTGEPQLSFNPKHPRDFNEAKSILKQIYAKGHEIYCDCPYDLAARERIDAVACGFKGHGVRAQRIEWEHVVPASWFGRAFPEWKEGDPRCERQGHKVKGRNCARETSEGFRRMEADLYNLLPAVGELNAARSNYPYAEVGGEPRAFGSCDFEVVHRQVEPRPAIRGDLARIYFYMDARYPGFGLVTKKNEGMLSAWDRDDPLDEDERRRLKIIEGLQGNSFFIGRLSRLSVSQGDAAKAQVKQENR